MSYPLDDLLLEVRDYIGDLGGDVDTPETYWKTNEDGLYWKNRELIRALNEALVQFGRRSPIHDTIGTDYQIVLVADQADYTYDADILTVEGLTLATEGTLLEKVTRERLDYLTDASTTWRSRDSGDPKYYCEDPKTRTITLHPTPDATDTLLVYCTRTPCANYETTDIGTDRYIFEPEDYNRAALVHYMLYRLYNKRGDNTFRPDMAEFHKREFTALVGPEIDERTLYNRRRNANMDLNIVPHPYTPNIKRRRSYHTRGDNW